MDDTGCKPLKWYLDADSDGHGNPGVSEAACDAPKGYVANGTDCDDTLPGHYAGDGARLTDGLPDACSGAVSASSVADLPLWTLAGSVTYAQLGSSLASTGDFDGDGEHDLVVGGSAVDVSGEIRGGGVLVFNGPLKTGAFDEGAADATLFSQLNEYASGVCALGDLDSDGYGDLAVGHPGGGADYSGATYVASGPLVGPIDLAVDALVYRGEALSDFGRCLGPGDVDGDSVPDLVVTAPAYDDGSSSIANVYVLRGPVDETSMKDPDQVLRASEDGEYLGYTAASVGDVDGDGTQDYAVSNSQLGSGTSDGFATYVVTDFQSGIMHPRDSGATVFYDRKPYYPRTMVPSRVGDINGDGYDDVALGDDYNQFGADLWILLGPFGAGDSLGLTADSDVHFFTLVRPSPWLVFAADLGDWNSDGNSVIAVADAGYSPPESAEKSHCKAGRGDCFDGAVYLVATPIDPGAYDIATVGDRVQGAYPTGYLGGNGLGPSLVGGSDLSGDGIPDLGMGAAGATTALGEDGAAYVLFGGGSP